MIWRLGLYAAVFGLASISAHKFGVRYSYADLKGYLDSLINVSSMIFTIMGIWIAFVYPNALSRLVDPDRIEVADFSETLTETSRLESIVGSILKSGLVVIGALTIVLGKVILGESPSFLSYRGEFKSTALGLVVALSFIQAEAVVSVLLANVTFLNDLHSKRQDRQTSEDI